jgi:pilus assembly protein CpaE
MASLTPPGKRQVLMVAGAGVPEELLNGILVPRGFAPVTTVVSLSELVARMRLLPPALVVVPVSGAGNGGEFAGFEMELRKHPGTAAIGTAPTKDADTVLAAMRAGILEFLVVPPDADELRVAVSRVLALSSGNASPVGRVYTVYSAKGGLGTSTVAASLAWELANRNGKQGVALADFTTTGAGVRVMLNLSPLYDLGNITARTDRIDRDLLRSVMVAHPEGVSVLAAAEEVDAADALDTSTANRLFEVLRQEYLYTVVDSDHHFADPTLAALDAADRIVLVTQLDVSALRSAQRTLGVFSRLGYGPEKVVIVANRRSDRDRISVSDAEKVLGRPVDFRIPNDYAACADAITNGQFVQRYAPSSPLVASLHVIATKLGGGTGGQSNGSMNGQPAPSRLSKLFGRR